MQSHTTDYDTIIQLALASGIIQTIGMFHRNPEQRTKSNVYHGMIVMVGGIFIGPLNTANPQSRCFA